jgi:hypothetical protein
MANANFAILCRENMAVENDRLAFTGVSPRVTL